jgi:hypothetical protein
MPSYIFYRMYYSARDRYIYWLLGKFLGGACYQGAQAGSVTSTGLLLPYFLIR